MTVPCRQPKQEHGRTRSLASEVDVAFGYGNFARINEKIFEPIRNTLNALMSRMKARLTNNTVQEMLAFAFE